MLGFAPDYDHLPLIAKVEVFDYALQNTEGNDLSRVWIAHGLAYFDFFPPWKYEFPWIDLFWYGNGRCSG